MIIDHIRLWIYETISSIFTLAHYPGAMPVVRLPIGSNLGITKRIQNTGDGGRKAEDGILNGGDGGGAGYQGGGIRLSSLAPGAV